MGTALVKIPQLATQNLDLDSSGKPKLKANSPAAKAKHVGAAVVGSRSPFGKAHKPMTDSQLERRKKAAATSTNVTSTLSLGALGAAGAGEATTRLGSLKKVPKMVHTGKNLTKGALPVSLISGGIAGVSGYNSAAIQREEARRRAIGKAAGLSKTAGLSKAYNPERNRYRRNNAEVAGVGVGAAGALGGAAYQGQKLYGQHRDVNEGKNILGGRNTALGAARERHGEALSVHEKNKGAYNKAKNTVDSAKANKARWTASQTLKFPQQQEALKRTKKAQNRSASNIKTRETAIAVHQGKYDEAARGLKALKKIRRGTATKAGLLATLGAGGVAGGMYLHKLPQTPGYQSYSSRYRPGLS